jgi:hypothetical protein
MIGIKIRSPLRKHLGLILHILPAAGDKQQYGKAAGGNNAPPRCADGAPGLIPDP